MQIHLGVLRNPNSRRFRELGPDTGFDAMDDLPQARPLAKFLDRLESDRQLPGTIVYNINPSDNEPIATVLASFQDGLMPGKMQFGSGWWFLDQKNGMKRQMETLANMGLLSRFVGMVTDSRSFLSYPRHEYFRRVLCDFIGDDIERGDLPADMTLAGRMAEDICYGNAEEYFGCRRPEG
jgi:glucuronate isomerase